MLIGFPPRGRRRAGTTAHHFCTPWGDGTNHPCDHRPGTMSCTACRTAATDQPRPSTKTSLMRSPDHIGPGELLMALEGVTLGECPGANTCPGSRRQTETPVGASSRAAPTGVRQRRVRQRLSPNSDIQAHSLPSPENSEAMRSRLSWLIDSNGMPFGQTAAHSPILVQ